MLNKVILIGRVGRDPEVRATRSGERVANLSLATSRKYTDAAGEKHEATEWHEITAWGKTSTFVEQYVRKGALLYVEGELRTEKWEKDGQPRQKTVIKANIVQSLSRPDGDRQAAPAPAPAPAPAKAEAWDAGAPDFLDDSIPFAPCL